MMGLLGFIDDYLKVVKGFSKGLIARYKLIGQITIGLIIGSILYVYPEKDVLRTAISIPFVSHNGITFDIANGVLDLNFFYIPFVIFIMTATSNAVNLTDGLDGLASGLVAISTLAFGAIAYASGRYDFSNYLNIIYLPGTGELLIFVLPWLVPALDFFGTMPTQLKFLWATLDL